MPKNFKILLGILVAADIFIWGQILFKNNNGDLKLYFLDVGQGDSQLILADGIKIMIDGGPVNGRALENLAKLLLSSDRYIDLLVFTHPQLDHYGGFIDVFKNYNVGAFIASGRKGESDAYLSLVEIIKDKKIPYIALIEGRVIRYKDLSLEVLSPSLKNLSSSELNDTSLVILLKDGDLKVLYTGDIGANVEKELADQYDLSAQVLKVGHHGSRFSSSKEFLQELKPKIAIIEVGEKNTYGHPTSAVLGRLADVGAQVFRTDVNGLMGLILEAGKLKAYTY